MGLGVPGSGPGGWWFKSTRPDHSFALILAVWPQETPSQFRASYVRLGPMNL
jgi:hypothetical protein